jgi:hypothetical protein
MTTTHPLGKTAGRSVTPILLADFMMRIELAGHPVDTDEHFLAHVGQSLEQVRGNFFQSYLDAPSCQILPACLE